MRAADLKKATALTATLEADRKLRGRLEAGEALALTVGTGAEAAGIVLSADYAGHIRRDLLAAFDLRIGNAEASLRAMGVEP